MALSSSQSFQVFGNNSVHLTGGVQTPETLANSKGFPYLVRFDPALNYLKRLGENDDFNVVRSSVQVALPADPKPYDILRAAAGRRVRVAPSCRKPGSCSRAQPLHWHARQAVCMTRQHFQDRGMGACLVKRRHQFRRLRYPVPSP